MSPEEFVAKWTASTLTERAAAQSHFNDLCEVLGVEKPTDADPKGEWYCFERGAAKTAGGDGWADVWKRKHFGWEYKGKRKNLSAAYAQLQQYAVALENPPLLVVSDMDRIVVHTNWTNTVSEVHTIPLQELTDASNIEKLRWVFTDPDRLKPQKTTDALTRDVADKFATLAISLGERGYDPQVVAHFLNRLMFCMFAEDIDLLPKHVFARIIEAGFQKPHAAESLLSQLFSAMSGKEGFFGTDEIDWFNGGLFDDSSTLPLARDDLKLIGLAASHNWSDIDPSIFGTLFERGLDPSKRVQLGAHYTDIDKITKIVEAVVIDPLISEWETTRAQIEKKSTSKGRKNQLLSQFLERLRTYRVLDPACGSGNFLYVALLALKDLEHRVGLEAEALGLPRPFPSVGPTAVMGIEVNKYAAELARVTIWIGEIQWMKKHGFGADRNPVLKPLSNITTRDALINQDGTSFVWPNADAIVGNPPFLGSRKMVPELGDAYTAAIRRAHRDIVADGSDLVCFWFGKAWQKVREEPSRRVGLIATNSISGGSSRKVLEPIANAKAMFEVWRDQPWIVDGADVDVSIVCFSGAPSESARLNGAIVERVFADLYPPTSPIAGDLTTAKRLNSNVGISFQGVVPRSNVKKARAKELGLPPASFVIPGEIARPMLLAPENPNGRYNSDVIAPYLIGDEVGKRPRDRFIIDFGTMTAVEAALYEQPFAYIQPVKAHREAMVQPEAAATWWQHWRPRADMKKALGSLPRYIATSRVSKHRIFVWRSWPILPDNAVVAIARDDDVTFGILHSRFHRLWALRQGTSLQNRPRYTSTTTFETFPFPAGLEPNKQAINFEERDDAARIGEAARTLNHLREAWLNPPSLIRETDEVVANYPRRMSAIDEKAARELKKKTLVSLYNDRPPWLEHAHAELDKAVAASYGFDFAIGDDEVLQELLRLNIWGGGTSCPGGEEDEDLEDEPDNDDT